MFRKMKEDVYFKGVVVSVLVCMMLVIAIAAQAGTGGVISAEAGADAVKALLDKVVFPIFSGLVLSLLSILIHRISSKYKIDILTANQELIEKAALQGISLAEEYAAKQVGDKVSGNAKLLLAIKHVQTIVPTIEYDQARNVIDGMLARIPGVGATKEKVVAVQ